MFKIKRCRNLILPITLLFTSYAYGQITIGSSNEPDSGVILDLKDNYSIEYNSSKGLLPRVNFTDLEQLYSIFSSNLEYSGTNKSLSDEQHIGLVAYNTNQADYL